MDKLEPILKQKFWIILGVGVILTITGWWMATGSLSAAIADRKTAIEKASNDIPSGEVPNNDWTTKLSAINTRQEEMVTVVERQMWEDQKATMFWPESVADFVSQLDFRGEFLGEAGLVARDLYRSSYIFTAQEVWMKVRPILPDGTGIVLFPFEAMPHEKWGSLAPKSPEIWDAQEDLWLLSPILDAIREVNGGENGTRLDASIHVINKLELLGGERTTGDAGDGGGGGGGGGYDGAMGGAEAGMFGGGGGGGGGSGQNSGPKTVKSEFSLEEEFGSSGRKGGGGGGGGGGMFSGAASAEYSMDAGSGDSGGGAVEIRRYVDDTDDLPYKTRGFYMSLTMDHRRVPHLIGELTASGNSPWPMEILRVQVARVNPDDATGQSLGGNPMMTMGGQMGGAGFGNESPEYSSGFGAGGTPESAGASFDSAAGGGAGSEGFSNPTMPTQLEGRLSMAAALQDPFIAKVTIAGLIYLYKPVAPPTASEAATPEEGIAADPAASEMPAELPTETTPAETTVTTESVPMPAETPEGSDPSVTPAAPAANPDGSAPAVPQPAEPAATPPPENSPPEAASPAPQ